VELLQERDCVQLEASSECVSTIMAVASEGSSAYAPVKGHAVTASEL
jgi:hypothetical protein